MGGAATQQEVSCCSGPQNRQLPWRCPAASSWLGGADSCGGGGSMNEHVYLLPAISTSLMTARSRNERSGAVKKWHRHGECRAVPQRGSIYPSCHPNHSTQCPASSACQRCPACNQRPANERQAAAARRLTAGVADAVQRDDAVAGAAQAHVLGGLQRGLHTKMDMRMPCSQVNAMIAQWSVPLFMHRLQRMQGAAGRHTLCYRASAAFVTLRCAASLNGR